MNITDAKVNISECVLEKEVPLRNFTILASGRHTHLSWIVSGNIMKYLILAIIILTAIGCSTGTQKNNSSQQQDTSAVSVTEQLTSERPKPLEANETEEVIDIKSLTGTIWIRRPFEDFPNCVDTLNFVDGATGYEYRCEFESTNKIDYFYSGDTLEIHEYGHVSEVHNLGLEVKYRWRYIQTNKKFNLVGYIEGTEDPIAPTTNDITYELLKLGE